MCGQELLQRREVHSVADMPLHRFDARTFAYQLPPLPSGLIDPFLGVDAFDMPHHFFLPHPHGGMSAVTLLLDDSPGGVINRDSQGDHSTIAPGDLHWTQAGSGIIHEETPSQPGQSARGLQIFVNMARARKQDPAAVFKTERADMPVWQGEGARLKVAAGRYAGPNITLSAPISADARWATPVNLWAIELEAHAYMDLSVPDGHNSFAIVTHGALSVGDHEARAPQSVLMSPAQVGAASSSVVSLKASDAGAKLVWFSGAPLREPTVQHGPFVGNTRDDIMAYIHAFQSGAMGELLPSFTR
jgi:redox-sensitive bicupin YhaK (pirin superfamily)